MIITNKVTTCRNPTGLTDEAINDHIAAQNAEGWYLVAVDNLVGWYRFFWAKEE